MFEGKTDLELSNILILLEDTLESLKESDDIERINKVLKDIELIETELRKRF